MTDLVEITVPLVQDTEIALFVSRTGDREAGVWLRKREIIGFELAGCGHVFVVLPRALAQTRGLA